MACWGHGISFAENLPTPLKARPTNSTEIKVENITGVSFVSHGFHPFARTCEHSRLEPLHSEQRTSEDSQGQTQSCVRAHQGLLTTLATEGLVPHFPCQLLIQLLATFASFLPSITQESMGADLRFTPDHVDWLFLGTECLLWQGHVHACAQFVILQFL